MAKRFQITHPSAHQYMKFLVEVPVEVLFEVLFEVRVEILVEVRVEVLFEARVDVLVEVWLKFTMLCHCLSSK